MDNIKYYLSIVPLFLLWCFYQKLIKLIVTHTDHRLYANVVSITHSTIMTVISLITLMTQCLIDKYIYMFSISYFLFDMYNAPIDILFILHHLVSITILWSTFIFHSVDYVNYVSLLIFISEVTSPCQNYFFMMKLAYGDHQKVKFYAEYQRFFEFYSVSFIVCRLILAPIVLSMFLSNIKEDIYYYIILASAIFIIIGSLIWMIGQCRLIHKIKKTKE